MEIYDLEIGFFFIAQLMCFLAVVCVGLTVVPVYGLGRERERERFTQLVCFLNVMYLAQV